MALTEYQTKLSVKRAKEVEQKDRWLRKAHDFLVETGWRLTEKEKDQVIGIFRTISQKKFDGFKKRS